MDSKKGTFKIGGSHEDGDRHEDTGKEQREEVMVTGGNIRVDNQKGDRIQSDDKVRT